MKNIIKTCFFALIFLSLGGCGTYQIATQPRVKVEKLLAINSAGDTVQVSIDRVLREYSYGSYQNWSFNWNNQWYPNQAFPYYFYSNPYRWYGSTIYNRPYIGPSVTVPLNRPRTIIKGRRGSNNLERNDQFNRPNFRSERPAEGNSNGRRSSSREVISPRQTQPRITPNSQPRQIRRGSQPPSVQQPIKSSSPSRQGGRRPIDY